MTRVPLWILASALALALAPAATAGSAEAPELTDAAGDCAFAPGNEYLDVVSAWISDETATDFVVNLAISKWTPYVGQSAALTVQFVHQDVQWGTVYYHDSMDGWAFLTGRVTSDGDTSDFNETTGAFTPGEPAVLSATFPKALFPHAEAMDHEVKDFWAASIDLKGMAPGFLTAMLTGQFVPGPALPCDEATGDGVFTFQQGQHSMQGMDHGARHDAGNATTPDAGAANASASGSAAAPAATAAGDAGNATPAPGAVAALALAAAVARCARRHA